MQDWLRLAEAAELAQAPRSTFDDAVRRGEIAFAEIGGFRFFHPDDVIAWSEQRRDGRTSAPAGKPRETAEAAA
jgi:excisionase family DNA binding protein